MNSVQGYKGFITFMVLSGIFLTVLLGFNYISQSTDTRTRAKGENAASPIDQPEPLKFNTEPAESVEMQELDVSDTKNKTQDQNTNGSPHDYTDSDYEGIMPIVTKETPKSVEIDHAGILGAQTNLLNEMVSDEFSNAIKYQDPKYDFNNDGEVTNLDYPLFIEFISNPED